MGSVVGAVDLERLRAGDTRALARALSLLESREPGGWGLISELWSRRGDAAPAQVVGLTGPPGSGKSTMVDALIALWRAEGRRVAVLAVDPNSPFSGGAILGDRVRMQRHAVDPGVFIRSMGARGHLGGVSLATRAAVRLLDACGWEMVLVETVGVGQSELEICEIADSVVVVTTPAAGDGVQVIKAGITEIADLFAVNKADLPGVDRVVRELRDLVRVHPGEGVWAVPVVKTVAAQGQEGVAALAEALDRHRQFLVETGGLEQQARRRVLEEAVELVSSRASGLARRELESWSTELADDDPRQTDPGQLAERVWQRIREGSVPSAQNGEGDRLAASL